MSHRIAALTRAVKSRLAFHEWITGQFPAFAPFVAGNSRDRAAATVAAVNQTIPLMADIAAIGKPASPIPSARDLCADEASEQAARRLRELFLKHGSDKSTNHNYEYVYAHVLGNPAAVTAVLEIGLGTTNAEVLSNMGPVAGARPGGSLRAFRDYLPNAEISGADIDRNILFTEDRITTYWVDQTDRGSLDRLGDQVGGEFDLIIDDGLHAPHANLNTLYFALPRLRRGGSVVIEDIWDRSLAIWQVAAEIMPDDFAASLVEAKGAYMFLARRKTG